MGKLLVFIFGVLLGVVGAFGAIIYWEMRKPAPPDDEIIFARKNFWDSQQAGADGYVSVSGTLTGKDMSYPNNTYALTCSKEYRACFVSYVQQIGHNQIGRMENPFTLPIVKWNDYEVIAQEEPSPTGCARTTVTIDRKRQALLWLIEPINQTKPNCKDADTSIRKYSIEDSPGWKRIFENK
jgi:hypothetical protein